VTVWRAIKRLKITRKKTERPGVWGGVIQRRNPPKEAEISKFSSQSSW
jgi:hypothetical protein